MAGDTAPSSAALVALPPVGAAIGALAGYGALGVAHIAPRSIAAAVGLALLVTLSGAIHLDGFLDGCDAFFASVPPERRREILKDPRHGSFAAAGLLCAGVLWYGALLALAPAAYPATFAVAAALGRAAAVANAFTFSYARGGPPPAVPFAFVVALIAGGAYLIAPFAALFVPAALALSFLLARWIASRLEDDLPGDAYGFITTLLEIAALAALAALLAAGGTAGRA